MAGGGGGGLKAVAVAVGGGSCRLEGGELGDQELQNWWKELGGCTPLDE